MFKQKRIVTIQDISCFGKCSQTVSLPILSSAGLETVILPTALLSSHTGGLEGYTFLDLKDELNPISDHWKSLGLEFDGVLTGYVGSSYMIELLTKIIKKLKNDQTIVLSDPAMADNGKLYPGFDKQYVNDMAKLCFEADIIIPNITEACMMLDLPYQESNYNSEYVEDLLRKLCEKGPKISVLTGISFNSSELGACLYDKESNTFEYAFNDRIEGYYHGTGDIFANAFFGAVMNDKALSEALQIAVNFTHDAIERTFIAKTDIRFGVNFEAGLLDYARWVK